MKELIVMTTVAKRWEDTGGREKIKLANTCDVLDGRRVTLSAEESAAGSTIVQVFSPN